jgi:hypothetical protein
LNQEIGKARLSLFLLFFLSNVKADDFGIILALINSEPHREHFPLMIALPLASLTYTASAIVTFSWQEVQ